jgi:hypothetical protein
MAIGEYAVNLPSIYQSPGEALQSMTAQEERKGQRLEQLGIRKQQEDERKAKEAEQERLRGLSIVESGARLDKLPPDEQASIIAQNAVESEKARLKALLNNKVIDPVALSSNVDEAMKNITKASSTFSLEYNNADKLAESVAHNNPSIDIVALKRDLRDDVRNRRIKDGKFVDPNSVEPSALISQINNQDFLGKYINEYNSINKVIASKQSSEPARVMVGTPREYSTYAGRTGFWSKPTFESDALGFVTGGKAPSQAHKGIEVLNEPLPVGALKGVNQKFDMVPANVYQRFVDEGGVQAGTEISALAQKKFPTYTNFTPQEKEFANRKALYDYLSEKDADGFANVGYTSPPRSIYGEPKPTESAQNAKVVGDYINSLTSSIKSNNETDIKGLFNRLYGLKGGKSNYAGVDVYKRPDGTVTGFKVNYTNNEGERTGSEIIKTNDPSLDDKIQGIYQKVSGSQNALEIANLRKLGTNNPTNYAPVIEEKINIVMKNNPGATREQVIAELKRKGKIK